MLLFYLHFAKNAQRINKFVIDSLNSLSYSLILGSKSVAVVKDTTNSYATFTAVGFDIYYL